MRKFIFALSTLLVCMTASANDFDLQGQYEGGINYFPSRATEAKDGNLWITLKENSGESHWIELKRNGEVLRDIRGEDRAHEFTADLSLPDRSLLSHTGAGTAILSTPQGDVLKTIDLGGEIFGAGQNPEMKLESNRIIYYLLSPDDRARILVTDLKGNVTASTYLSRIVPWAHSQFKNGGFYIAGQDENYEHTRIYFLDSKLKVITVRNLPSRFFTSQELNGHLLVFSEDGIITVFDWNGKILSASKLFSGRKDQVYETQPLSNRLALVYSYSTLKSMDPNIYLVNNNGKIIKKFLIPGPVGRISVFILTEDLFAASSSLLKDNRFTHPVLSIYSVKEGIKTSLSHPDSEFLSLIGKNPKTGNLIVNETFSDGRSELLAIDPNLEVKDIFKLQWNFLPHGFTRLRDSHFALTGTRSPADDPRSVQPIVLVF